MSDNKDDIFKKAAEDSLKNGLSKVEEEQILEQAEIATQEALALAQTSEGDKWDNLTKYINNDGADRLLKELQSMPSKDYVRNYLKLLEYFKPKLVRSDINPDDDIDRTITVELVQQLPSGEKRIMTVNKTEKSNHDTQE